MHDSDSLTSHHPSASLRSVSQFENPTNHHSPTNPRNNRNLPNMNVAIRLTSSAAVKHARFASRQPTVKTRVQKRVQPIEEQNQDNTVYFCGTFGALVAIAGALYQLDNAPSTSCEQSFVPETSLYQQIRQMKSAPCPHLAKSQYELVYWTPENMS